MKQFLEKQDFSQLELDLSAIKTKALADFKALVQKSNPFTGEDVPTLEDVLLNLDDDGLGLCNTGPLVRIPLKVLAADGIIDINISAGKFENLGIGNQTRTPL